MQLWLDKLVRHCVYSGWQASRNGDSETECAWFCVHRPTLRHHHTAPHHIILHHCPPSFTAHCPPPAIFPFLPSDMFSSQLRAREVDAAEAQRVAAAAAADVAALRAQLAAAKQTAAAAEAAMESRLAAKEAEVCMSTHML